MTQVSHPSLMFLETTVAFIIRPYEKFLYLDASSIPYLAFRGASVLLLQRRSATREPHPAKAEQLDS
jgi:hypothetical protein